MSVDITIGPRISWPSYLKSEQFGREMHTLPVHVRPHKVVILLLNALRLKKKLGVLTIWRKPGNLDKTRTRTYYMGEVPKPGAKVLNGCF